MVSKINHAQPGYEFSHFWKVQTRSVGYFDWEIIHYCWNKYMIYIYIYMYTGWWFGTFFIFHFIYRMSSFPLTFNIFSGVKTTNLYIYIYIYIHIYIYTYIEGPPSRMHFSYADAAPKAGPGGSAVWAQADWQPNAFSTTELWGDQLQRIMLWKACILLGKACGSKTGKGCRNPCGQTPRRPRYPKPKLLLLKPACK